MGLCMVGTLETPLVNNLGIEGGMRVMSVGLGL